MSAPTVRVLLVEDSLQDAAIVRRVLRSDEHFDVNVDCVASARECLERLKEDTFDLLLLDYNLPGERLEVNKVRGASKVTGRIIAFDVEPGVGIVPAIIMTKVQA